MTKARLHPSLIEFQGAMGDMVFKKRGKKVYVSIKPEGTSDPSEAQVAQRKYFRKAVNYATTALADETSRAFYEELAERRETTARALCVGDFLNSPEPAPSSTAGPFSSTKPSSASVTFTRTTPTSSFVVIRMQSPTLP